MRSMFLAQNSRCVHARDVARIFHHVGQQLAEQRGVHRVDFLVAIAHEADAVDRARGVDVEHFLELRQRQFGKRLQPAEQARRLAPFGDRHDTLGDILAEIADALQVAPRCGSRR